MAIKTLAESPHYYSALVEFIENSFHYPDDYSFEVDFLPLIHKNNWKNLYFLEENGRILAHLGLRPVTFSLSHPNQKNSMHFPMAFLGGIAVDENLRGQGLFKTLIEHIFRTHEKDYALFFLWSELRDLYQKFDFFLCGGMRESKGSSSPEDLGYSLSPLEELTEEEKKQIKDLHKMTSELFLTPLREDKDWDHFFQMHSMELFLKSSDQKIESYLLRGKGADLEGIIHEWGGRDLSALHNDLLSLYAWFPEGKWWGESLLTNKKKVFKEKSLEQEESYTDLQHMVFCRKGSDPLFSSFLKVYSGERLKVKSLASSEIHFSIDDQDFSLSQKDFFLTLFGPKRAEEFSSLRPLWISGGESV